MRQGHGGFGWVTGLLAGTAACVVGLGAAGLGGCKSDGKAGGEPPTSAKTSGISKEMGPVEVTQLRERAIDELVTAARSERAELRANALEALIPVPARLDPLLRASLVDANVGVRSVAAAVAGKAKLCSSTPMVEPLTRDVSPLVQAAALYSMAVCGHNPDLTPLGSMLLSDQTRVRAQAAYFVGELRNPSALELLKESAANPPTGVTPAELRSFFLQLAEARAKLRDKTALEELRAALHPATPDQLEGTVLAAFILGQVGDTDSIGSLIVLCAELDDAGKPMPAEVRLAAAGSLAKMGKPEGSLYIVEQYWELPAATIRAQSAYVLGEIAEPRVLPYLAKLLEDKDARVRVAAAGALIRVVDRNPLGVAGAASKGRESR